MSKQFSRAKRKRIFDRYGGRCAICKIELHMDIDRSSENDYIQIDHILPKHLGGSNKEENLRALCRSCNSRRKGTTGDELGTNSSKRIRGFLL